MTHLSDLYNAKNACKLLIKGRRKYKNAHRIMIIRLTSALNIDQKKKK